MKLNEDILRIKEIMGLERITESSPSKSIQEQDDWTSRAASGRQKCGKEPRWCPDGGDGERLSTRGEKPMSGKKLKKYTENEYWNNQLLSSPASNPDYQERASNMSSDVANIPGSITDDQKMFVVYNLTNRLNRSSEWYFRNIVKNQVKTVSDKFTDKDVINFIISKGGFDQFKKYYLEDVIG